MSKTDLRGATTIYSFRLVKKAAYRPILVYSYLAVLALYVVIELFTSPAELAMVPVSYTLILGLHGLITVINLKFKEERTSDRWQFQWMFPWVGFLPKSHISASMLVHLHIQLGWVGLALIGCVYPWVTLSIFLQLVFLHFWILLPRYVLFRLLPKPEESGMIKIGGQETSYYVQ